MIVFKKATNSKNFLIPNMLMVAMIVMLGAGCQSLKDRKNDYFSNVTHVISQKQSLKNIKKIALNTIVVKNVNFAGLSASNLQDNLRFELMNSGYRVRIHRSKPQATRDEVTGEIVEKAVRLKKPERITQVIAEKKSDLLVNGYIFETRTGDLLDEEISTAVVLFAYGKDGRLAAIIRYTGKDTLESYDNGAEIARMLSIRLHKITHAK